jgi:hypothetical protein
MWSSLAAGTSSARRPGGNHPACWNLGQVTGLLSDGLRLANPVYLESLLQTGIDHLLLILHPEDEASWQALEQALAADLFVAVHVTVTEAGHEAALALLDRLVSMGVYAVSLSASDPKLSGELKMVRDRAASLGLELVWNLSVPYSTLHPVALETAGGFTVEGAGRAWLYVEPDGDVRAAPGAKDVLGNLLHDEWEKIWKK